MKNLNGKKIFEANLIFFLLIIMEIIYSEKLIFSDFDLLPKKLVLKIVFFL